MSNAHSKYCGHCGEKVIDSSKFCAKCGVSLHSSYPTQKNVKNTKPAVKAKTAQRQVYYALAVLVSAITLVVIFWTNIFVFYSNLTADKDVKRVAAGAGLSLKGEYIYYKSNPQLVSANQLDKVCPREKSENIEYGCFDTSTNSIYILKIPDGRFNSIEYTTAAHEMLHAAWQSLDDQERSNLGGKLMKLYNAKSSAGKKLRTSLKRYGNIDKNLLHNELHSFVGSEISNGSISLYLEDYYDKYFANRTRSVLAQTTFEDAIDSRIADLDSQRKAIQKKTSEIDAYKANYIDSFGPIQQQNLYYGDYYNYNLNVDKYNGNLKSYETMISDYNSSVDFYNQELNDFRSLMKSLYPTKKLPGYLK